MQWLKGTHHHYVTIITSTLHLEESFWQIFIHNCQMERQSFLCLVLQSFIWQYLEQYFAILHPPQAFNLNSWLHALQTFGSYLHFIKVTSYPLSTGASAVSLKWAWILSLFISQWINSQFVLCSFFNFWLCIACDSLSPTNN